MAYHNLGGDGRLPLVDDPELYIGPKGVAVILQPCSSAMRPIPQHPARSVYVWILYKWIGINSKLSGRYFGSTFP